jgi:hypothetical protein
MERRGAKFMEKVFPRLPAMSNGPVVLAVPTRVATKLELQAVGHDSRAVSPRLKPLRRYDILTGAAPGHGRAMDVLPISSVRATLSSQTRYGVRSSTSF